MYLKQFNRYCLLLGIASILLYFSGCKETLTWQYNHSISLDDAAPIGIAYNNGRIWISDAENNRVLQMDTAGNILKQFDGFERPMHLAFYSGKVYVPEYLTDTIKIISNENIETFPLTETPDAPASVDVSNGKIAIADFYNHRIIVMKNDEVSTVGEKGHDKGKLFYPTDVKIFNEKFYVADGYNHRVQVFDKEGQSLLVIGNQDSINVVAGIDVTKDFIAVADQGNNRVLIYNHQGKLLQKLQESIDYPTDVLIVGDKLYVVNFEGRSLSVYEQK